MSAQNGKKVIVSDKLSSDISFLLSGWEEVLDDEWHLVTLEQCHLDELVSPFSFCKTNTYSVESFLGEVPMFMPLRSFCIHQILKKISPDFVLVVGSPGLVYFSLLSTQQGGYLSGTNFILVNPVSVAQSLEMKKQLPAGRTEIELNAMERDSFKRFDLVFDTRGDDFYTWSLAAGWNNSNLYVECEKKSIPPTNRQRNFDKLNFNQKKNTPPLITVCLTSYNRPEMLSEALRSLTLQSDDIFEVIVVDDGSSTKNKKQVQSLEKQYKKDGWRFFYQVNKGPGAARNFAASMSMGTHLLFMDDDNWALSNELSLFRRAAISSDADIYTCIPGWHPDSEISSGTEVSVKCDEDVYDSVFADWLPLGGHADLGVFINCYGDTNALYKKSSFLSLEGYDESNDYILEDMELFTRSVNHGYRLEVVPEILFLYRKHRNSRTALDQPVFASHIKTLTSFSSQISITLWPLLLCLRKGFFDRHNEITQSLSENLETGVGEWIEINDDNPKVRLVEFERREEGWGPRNAGSEIYFNITNAGKSNSFLLECKGRELLLTIGGKVYVPEIKDCDKMQLTECRLHPGALNSNGETRIIFDGGGDVVIRRFAVMQTE
ncbi:glycosyltransferase family 2 protein [Kiloniella sp.]|uniref:glycosyltransferase family 2 protein n=1 Tax=Kiloniella sp. TaxID=1938587 RepID=UPI003A8DEA98